MASQAVTNIPQHFKDLFHTNFGHQAQQMMSRLRGYVDVETGLNAGNRKSYDDYDARPNQTKKTERGGKTRRRDALSTRRWLVADPYDDAVLIDEFDEERLGDIGNPRSDMLQSMIYAHERTVDRIILDGLENAVVIGSNGTQTSSPAFPTAQVIGDTFKYDTDGYTPTTGTASGLTSDKIREVIRRFGVAEVFGLGIARTGDMPIIAASSNDLNALWADVKSVLTNNNINVPFSQGLLESYFGVKFLRCEQLTVASSKRHCMAWVPSAVKFYSGQYRTHIDVLPDEEHSVQIRIVYRAGAMRRYDNRVIRVETKA